MNALIGEELDKDETFWGHETWKEEAVEKDDMFTVSSTLSDEYDSDIDDSESSAGAAEVVVETRKKKTTGGYKDPALARARKKAGTPTGGGRKKKAKAAASASSTPTRIRSSRKAAVRQRNYLAQKAAARENAKPKTPRAARKPDKVWTQEELMAEAAMTEAKNTASLKRIILDEEAQEAERKERNRKRAAAKLKGPRTILYSRDNVTTPTFTH